MLGSQIHGETPPVSTKKTSDFGMAMYENCNPVTGKDYPVWRIQEWSFQRYPWYSQSDWWFQCPWTVLHKSMGIILPFVGWTIQNISNYQPVDPSISCIYHKPPLNLGRKRLGQVSNNISKRYSTYYTITSTFWLNYNLVGGFNPSEKILVSWDYYSQHMEK